MAFGYSAHNSVLSAGDAPAGSISRRQWRYWVEMAGVLPIFRRENRKIDIWYGSFSIHHNFLCGASGDFWK